MQRRNPTAKPQAIDDMTGFKVDYASLKRQWDGAWAVNPDRRNPQDSLRARTEQPPLDHPRPEPADVFLASNITLEDGFTPIINPDGSPLMSESGPLGGAGL